MREAHQQTIRELFNQKVHDNCLVSDYNLFDSSVTQKLWSTKYYYEKLTSLDINEFREFPKTLVNDTSSLDTEKSSVFPQKPDVEFGVEAVAEYASPPDLYRYCRYLNLFLDGFFMNSMSILDTLAHQIFILYSFPEVPDKIYIRTAKEMLGRFHSASKTFQLLEDHLEQKWFKEFEPFRHCTTHESLIRYDDIKFSFDPVNIRYSLSEPVKLPDNPQARPFTYLLNRVVSEYCQSTLINIQSLVVNIYDREFVDVYAKQAIIPVPADCDSS